MSKERNQNVEAFETANDWLDRMVAAGKLSEPTDRSKGVTRGDVSDLVRAILKQRVYVRY